MAGVWSNALNPVETWTAVGTETKRLMPIDRSMRFYRLKEVNTNNVPPGMVLVPAGSFQMGDTYTEGGLDERPLHTVYISEFYLDRYEVTRDLWDSVKTWSAGNGYTFANVGSGKTNNHPVQTISWHDAVKWCNARSQMQGLEPVYYSDASLTQVFKTNPTDPFVKWNANGYRLPTEAEWEKAARGGAVTHRFPWVDAESITHGRANYYSTSSPYDVSPTSGYHPTYAEGDLPYTSPVGAFLANTYGLFDMSGNVAEWCWDFYSNSYYTNTGQIDPHGPATGSNRIQRGGHWGAGPTFSRCARRWSAIPTDSGTSSGFRCARKV